VTGLTYTDLVIGTYALTVIIGIELGIILRLTRKVGLLRDSLKSTSSPSNNTANEADNTPKIPKEKKDFVKDDDT
jgi:hypothetical protein